MVAKALRVIAHYDIKTDRFDAYKKACTVSLDASAFYCLNRGRLARGDHMVQRIFLWFWRRDRSKGRIALALLVTLLITSGCGAVDSLGQDVATETAASPEAASEDAAVPAAEDEAPTSTNVSDEAASETQVEQSSTTATSAPPTVNMPALIGMTEAEARSTLGALGVEDVSVQTRESFEPPGTVLDQVPSADKIITGSVSLVVAESIQPMPDFVGLKIAEAREWTDLRGIELRTETLLTDDTQPGQIVDQIPGPGAEVSQEIVVTVADAPVIVDLADYGWLDDSYGRRNEISMNGTVYPETIMMTFGCCNTSAWVSYDLSRDWSTLKMELGLSDKLSASAVVQVEIKGDSEVIYSDTIGFGAVQPVELDVTDILRLVIVATKVDGNETAVGLGEARLIGGAATGG